TTLQSKAGKASSPLSCNQRLSWLSSVSSWRLFDCWKSHAAAQHAVVLHDMLLRQMGLKRLALLTSRTRCIQDHKSTESKPQVIIPRREQQLFCEQQATQSKERQRQRHQRPQLPPTSGYLSHASIHVVKESSDVVP